MAEHPPASPSTPAATTPAELAAAETPPTTAPVDSPAPASAPTPLAAAPRGESRTTRLYRAALGPVNTARTLKVFARFDAAGHHRLVWHPAAGLFTLGWLVFRRLWTEALVYAAVVAGAIGLGLWAWPALQTWPPGVRWGVLASLLLLGVLLPGLLAYGWLHRQIQRRVLQVVAAAQSMDEACTALARQAPARPHLWAVVAAHAVLLPALWLGGPWRAAPDGPVAVSATVPRVVAVVPPEAPAPVAQQPDMARPDAEAPAPATLAEPAPPPSPRPEPVAPVQSAEPTRAAQPPSQEPSQGYGINVGLFADEGNARRAHERLLQAGLPATAQAMATPKGPRTRVRVGPFQRRADADAAAQRIRALGLEAVVFRP